MVIYVPGTMAAVVAAAVDGATGAAVDGAAVDGAAGAAVDGAAVDGAAGTAVDGPAKEECKCILETHELQQMQYGAVISTIPVSDVFDDFSKSTPK